MFATIGALTAASRCTWAFSRDGGIPGYQWWKVVNPRYGVPVNSLLLSTFVCALLGLIYLGSSAAFNAFTGGKSSDKPRERKLTSSGYHLPWLFICLPHALFSHQGQKRCTERSILPWQIWLLDRERLFLQSLPDSDRQNGITVVWISFSIILFCMRQFSSLPK